MHSVDIASDNSKILAIPVLAKICPVVESENANMENIIEKAIDVNKNPQNVSKIPEWVKTSEDFIRWLRETEN